LPWQPPLLQLNLLRIGTIWLGKLIGSPAANSFTCTGTAASRDPARTVTVARPSPRGRIMPAGSTVATEGAELVYVAEAVRSCRLAPARSPSTASCCTASGPRSTAFAG
jgi:hypothetical protein